MSLIDLYIYNNVSIYMYLYAVVVGHQRAYQCSRRIWREQSQPRAGQQILARSGHHGEHN